MSGLSSGEGLIWAVRDPIYKPVRKKGTGNHTDTTEETGGRTAERWFCTKNGYELNE